MRLFPISHALYCILHRAEHQPCFSCSMFSPAFLGQLRALCEFGTSCCFCRRLFSGSPPRLKSHYDVVIAGGGVMGCSSAFFLAQRMPGQNICIIERDPTYSRASTVLSVSSIRQQFSNRSNILLSLRSFKFLSQIDTLLRVEDDEPPDIQLHESGYLFLASEKGEEILRENHAIQVSLGAQVKLLRPSELSQKYPWLNLDGIALGSLGIGNEGWFDPWMLLHAFKKKVLSMGVKFVEGEVTDLTVEGDKVKDIKVSRNCGIGDEEVSTFTCDVIVNACGPWASHLARLAGIGDQTHPHPTLHTSLPVEPRRRCIFAVKSPDGPTGEIPLLVDLSGVYFRPELGRQMYIMGVSPPEEKDLPNLDLEVDYSLYEDIVWPSMAHRVPAFESLKVHNAWAGYYEYNTLDQNGIIGAHPVISNFVFANGFSGHGIQQSPAVGEAISEIILDGRSHTIDLQDLSFDRIINNQPVLERNVV